MSKCEYEEQCEYVGELQDLKSKSFTDIDLLNIEFALNIAIDKIKDTPVLAIGKGARITKLEELLKKVRKQ